jgi:membrane-associated protease RseP (regulator of RpoE activity)
MNRVISLSALVYGLLAAQGFAPAANMVRRADETGGEAITAPEQPLSAEAKAKLQSELVEMIEKGPQDVGGMQAMQRAVAAEMQQHMDNVLAAGPVLVQVEDKPGPGRDLIGQRTEKGTFLGVTTSHVTGALREQLGLQKGFGLVVDFVAKDSPAEAAGLKVHDVLTKLDDQLLVNTEQLAALVRAKKAGDQVTLTLIRGGKESKLTAKLVERDIPVDPMPEGWRGGMILPQPGFPGEGFEFHERHPGFGGWQLRGHATVSAPGDGTAHGTFKDNEHDITLTRDKDGNTTVIARDKDGNELYNGPYNTAEDKQKVPAELRAKIERIARNAATPAAGTIAGADTVTFRRVDDDHDIEMRINKGVKSLIVKDARTGKTIYEGTGEGEKELAKMPPAVAEKVRAMKAKVEPQRNP